MYWDGLPCSGSENPMDNQARIASTINVPAFWFSEKGQVIITPAVNDRPIIWNVCGLCQACKRSENWLVSLVDFLGNSLL